jgi:hypothetical protein
MFTSPRQRRDHAGDFDTPPGVRNFCVTLTPKLPLSMRDGANQSEVGKAGNVKRACVYRTFLANPQI